MKVAVVNNVSPFQRGGAELLAEALVRELRARDHEAELVRVPFNWSSGDQVVDSMTAAASMVIDGADRVVALKFPAYLVPHHNKVVWLLHQFRQVYDMKGTPFGWPDDPAGKRLARAVRSADAEAFTSAKALYCNSSTTADRLAHFNGFEAAVLHPPLTDGGGIRHSSYGDYVLALGRVNRTKRQLLAVEAMAQTRSDVRLVIAGPPEEPTDQSAIEEAIRRHGLVHRVTFLPGFHSAEDQHALLADALAVVYLPSDEDSYGYVTIEAMTASKPVVTVDDAGGLLQVVRNRETGLVCRAEPHAVATAFDQLHDDREFVARLGAHGRQLVEDLQLSWDHVVEVLTS